MQHGGQDCLRRSGAIKLSLACLAVWLHCVNQTPTVMTQNC